MPKTPTIKQRMLAGEGVGGCWISLFSPLATEIIAAAGYDCLLIDLEHGPGSVMDAIAMMQAMGNRNAVPLARIPENNAVWIKRVLDAGAAGIMLPAIDDAKAAAAAVLACHYAPRGNRGMAASIIRASGYGADVENYLANIGAELLLMCQIESAKGLANVDAIAATAGVDMIFIGPYDLSAAMGHLGQPDHPEVRAAITVIETATRKAGKLLGSIPTPERSAAALFAAGYDLVLADSDVGMLRQSAELGAQDMRDAIRQREDAAP